MKQCKKKYLYHSKLPDTHTRDICYQQSAAVAEYTNYWVIETTPR